MGRLTSSPSHGTHREQSNWISLMDGISSSVESHSPPYEVIGLGVSTVDVLALVDHLPAEEELELASQGTVEAGGPVATAIVALARLGARVAMVDSLGDDWRGRLIRDGFAREGVGTQMLVERRGAHATTALILVQRSNASRTIIWFHGTAAELEPHEIPQSAIASARILHVNGRHGATCHTACRWVRAAGGKVSFDGGAGMYREAHHDLIPLTDYCIVAQAFAERYTGKSDREAAAADLLAQGPELVVITDGLRGSWIFPRLGTAFHQPAFEVADMVDTTGCGDAYHGAFLFGLLRGMELRQTARLASAAAALNARALGGRAALPSLPQVERFLRTRDQAH